MELRILASLDSYVNQQISIHTSLFVHIKGICLWEGGRKREGGEERGEGE